MHFAFVHLVPDADPKEHRVTITKSAFKDLTVVGVKDYPQAVQVAKELANQGVSSILLCAGFGNVGLAKVTQAVGDKAAVGAVHFDCHPFLGFKSGDSIFDVE